MNKNEVYAAIALALHEFKGNNVHDKETGIITIQEKTTQWNGYAMSMTEHPFRQVYCPFNFPRPKADNSP